MIWTVPPRVMQHTPCSPEGAFAFSEAVGAQITTFLQLHSVLANLPHLTRPSVAKSGHLSCHTTRMMLMVSYAPPLFPSKLEKGKIIHLSEDFCLLFGGGHFWSQRQSEKADLDARLLESPNIFESSGSQ